ncbi:MAG: efflux RND transporter periplasmic adaptor subunit [Aestuariivita sp.]|nr:efflux RND transporter periplasmic adaptor subunit [Aestuariivita sp.]
MKTLSYSDSQIYWALFECLSDGVIIIDFNGIIKFANSDFCRMLNLHQDELLGSVFGEVFVTRENLDEFTQIVLDAVFNPGERERKIVTVEIGDSQRSLVITTTYLKSEEEQSQETQAMIATVSDITEIKELRENEVRLGKVVESQLSELQIAYRDIEIRSEELSSITRKVRVGRIAVVLIVLGLFVGIGSWRIQPLDLLSNVTQQAISDPANPVAKEISFQTFTVQLSELKATIALRGSLSLGRTEEIVSPFEGNISEVHVPIGEAVKEGEPLITLDTGQVSTELRRTEVSYIQARDKLNNLEDWANSDEMARSRSALRRAAIAIDEAEQALARSSFLLEQGIISALEHEQAERSRTNRELDYEAAQREFAATENKSNEEALLIARLELDTARVQFEALKKKLELSTVMAPISGVLIAAEGAQNAPLVKGRSVKQGDLLASIADFDRLSVVTSVDEVDLRKIKVNQRVLITGPGFPGLEIYGTVERVSTRAVGGSRLRGVPRFEVVISVDQLNSDARGQLRVGMSAQLEITVFQQQDAILIPIPAVEQFGQSTSVNIVNPETSEVEQRPVVIGRTTLNSVQVIEGLAVGELVVIP